MTKLFKVGDKVRITSRTPPHLTICFEVGTIAMIHNLEGFCGNGDYGIRLGGIYQPAMEGQLELYTGPGQP
jgi:hypothetical protein